MLTIIRQIAGIFRGIAQRIAAASPARRAALAAHIRQTRQKPVDRGVPGAV
jgi:hypothetical protein